MCGLVGVYSTSALDGAQLGTSILQAMAGAIAHRGPDSSGQWFDVESGIGLAHRRLAIMDLSEAGAQPMASASGRFVVAFNGEIYNHLALRADLDKGQTKYSWRGHSDTETILAGIEVWGLAATLAKCTGMFALALWDRESRRLFLARDRIGEKPLYYGWQQGVFLFGSELKALRVHPAFCGDIERDSIALFLRHNYIPAPFSIYKGIRKLPAGCFLEVKVVGEGEQETPQPYWSLTDAVAMGAANPFAGDHQDAVDELEKLLKDVVRGQMAADVPLGAFLSGGIDSSTIVAIMQAESDRPVNTFTIGFHETGYNEALHAKSVARHLGTEHTELYVTPEQAQAVISLLPSLYDEPFSDISQIPNFLISKLAREHVTVSLSGDGGDELFGGYARYGTANSAWNTMENLPGFMRNRISKSIKMIPVSSWDVFATPIKSFLPMRIRNVGDKMHKLAELLTPASRAEFYERFMVQWTCSEDVVIGAARPGSISKKLIEQFQEHQYIESMMFADSITYLPDDILVKIDRAAMGVALETRVPFLDHRIVEFAWSLPLSYKLFNGVAKWPLRQILHKYVPRELIERPKMGFSVPIDCWLRGPLRDWAEELLSESRLRTEGYLNPEPIRKKWTEHISGHRNWQYHLWSVLMFQAWLEENHQ